MGWFADLLPGEIGQSGNIASAGPLFLPNSLPPLPRETWQRQRIGKVATKLCPGKFAIGTQSIGVWQGGRLYGDSRVSVFLIEHLPSDLWGAVLPGTRSRTVRMVACHIHNSRRLWIKTLGGHRGSVDKALSFQARLSLAKSWRTLPRMAALRVSLLKSSLRACLTPEQRLP